ncbi:MAG TPA: MaoC/PaaZ C-terminal domain-containing protein, partial [Syntrophomonas sp.]|nr:MaoC/PaaZ C-terminal domain-containing protein [Syntrophomonas sp.]
TEFVGVPWKQVKKNISWRQTTNYAAAVSDMNPLYINDEKPEGVMAPPMFAVTLGWPIGKNIHKYIDVPYTREVLEKDVHYTEYVEFHRPIKPGESNAGINLTIQPSIYAMIAQRAGTNVVYKYDVMDENGELYHTEYNGTMLRGVECVDGGKGELPFVPKCENTEPIWDMPVYIPPELPYIYDGCTDIVFAIHTSPKFAHSVNLPFNLLQGTVTIAIGVREMINRELNGAADKVKAINAKLTAMVYPGSEIRVQLLEKRVGTEYVELFYRILNQEGQAALSNGYVKALL